MNKKKGYHITNKSNLYSIQKNGLQPRIGQRSYSVNEYKKLLYFTNSLFSTTIWKERFFENILFENLAVLTFDLNDIKYVQRYDQAGDFFTEDTILPENIKVIQIIDKDAPQKIISLEKLRDKSIYNEDNEQYQILEQPITELILEEKTIDSKKKNEIIEKLAEYEHKKWSEDYDRLDWKCERNKDGGFEISEEDIRQIQKCSSLDYEQAEEFYKKEIKSVIMETFYIMQENHMVDKLGISDEELMLVLEHTEYMRRNRWSQYMLSICQVNDGKYIIPAEKAKIWKSEMRTPYIELNENQKESDRKEVNNIFLEIQKYINMKKELKQDNETQKTSEPNIQEDYSL